MASERVEKLRELRARTSAPLSECVKALAAADGHVEQALEGIRHSPRYPRDTGDPFMGCKLGRGIGVDHRGKLYHKGCPAAHGGPW